jgi:hypothetical protein
LKALGFGEGELLFRGGTVEGVMGKIHFCHISISIVNKMMNKLIPWQKAENDDNDDMIKFMSSLLSPQLREWSEFPEHPWQSSIFRR